MNIIRINYEPKTVGFRAHRLESPNMVGADNLITVYFNLNLIGIFLSVIPKAYEQVDGVFQIRFFLPMLLEKLTIILNEYYYIYYWYDMF